MAEGTYSSVKRLLVAIGYPERTSDIAVPFTLRVDGMEVVAEEIAGRLVLSYALTDDDSLLPSLAAYASGRMLKENAVLAYGSPSAFVWQDVPADAGDVEMTSFFEAFMDSCEWWKARVDALNDGGGAQSAPASESMVILP